MSDKKTIQEALAEVQKNVDSQRIDETPNPFGIFGRAGKVASKGGKSAPIRPMPHGGEDLVGKAKTPKAAETIDIKAQPKTSVPSVPEAPKTGSGLGKAALGAGVGAAAGYGAYKAYDAFTKDKGPVGPDPSKFTPDTPKQPEAPKAPEKTAETPKDQKMSFNQAYAKARELAKSAGKNPNIAQFKFDRGGGEKVYQAAATKKDYVPMSKQYKVDIGTSKAAETPKQPETPKAAETPKVDTKPETTSTAPKAPEALGKTVGSLLRGDLGRAGEGAKEWGSAVATSVDRVRKNTADMLDPKGAQPEYESGKRKKMSEENINELSPFERTFAQKMKQLGPGKTYRDPNTGKNILLKYADNKPHTGGSHAPAKPSTGGAPLPPKRPQMGPPDTTWRNPAAIDYSKDNKAKPETLTTTPRDSAGDPARGVQRLPGGGEKGVGTPGGSLSLERPAQTPKPSTSADSGLVSNRPRPGQDAPGADASNNVRRMLDQAPMKTDSSSARPAPSSSSSAMFSPTPIAQQKPESESGGKKKKMSEDTNPLIASFLALQEKNPSNMFEAAKKLSKKQDEKLDVVDDDKIDAKDFAALRAGKKHVDEAVLKDPKDPSVQGSGDVTMSAPKPAVPAAAPVHVKPTNPEKLKNLKDPRDPSVQGSGDVTYKEEVEEVIEFSQAEIDHLNSFFLEASVAPNRPEVATGADSTSEKMSQNDVTGTSTESGKRIRKEEFEQIYELDDDTMRNAYVQAKKRGKTDQAMRIGNMLGKRSVSPNSDKVANPFPVHRGSSDPIYKEEVELEEGDLSVGGLYNRLVDHLNGENPSRQKAAAVEKAITKVHGEKVMGHLRKAVNANRAGNFDGEMVHIDNARTAAGKSDRIGSTVGSGRSEFRRTHEEVEIHEGRPKKNPEPEVTERDPRKHIQVEAGRAAAGNVIDFTHNDGSKSKITPAMGRRITAHLNGLKPADRQAAVNKMHDSAEGLKV